MATIEIKGREYATITVKDSHGRRAQQFRNNIIDQFRKLRLTEDDYEVSFEAVAFKKMPAFASWYFEGRHLYYSYAQARSYVENLYVVSKVIEKEINALINDEQSFEDFTDKFKEEPDVEEARKKAREELGLNHDTQDIETINKAYKELAKQHHPDKEDGDTEKFKRINNAHKTLKRELT